jgi:protein-tyrosine phosphatase
MDLTWITGRIAVGGGIWNDNNMALVARSGVTHVIDMQIEFDDRPLGAHHGVEVLWNPVDDDFLPKAAEVFERGVGFAMEALSEPGSKLFIHCAAGIHRAPMMAAALLAAMGWTMEQAIELIEARRPVVEFPGVYLESVRRFLAQRGVGRDPGGPGKRATNPAR